MPPDTQYATRAPSVALRHYRAFPQDHQTMDSRLAQLHEMGAALVSAEFDWDCGLPGPRRAAVLHGRNRPRTGSSLVPGTHVQDHSARLADGEFDSRAAIYRPY